MSASARAAALDALGVTLVHAAACAVARSAGLDHVSDDDFARVTIAQAFAFAPRLDPSGTSWLPFPFWALGGLMMIFGRSLATARALSILLASTAASLPYVALRWANVPRGRALFATALAFATPWAIWLGASTVPESFTASFTASGAIALGAALTRDTPTSGASSVSSRARVASFAAAVVAACLSRYEPWPAAAVLGLAALASALRVGVPPRSLASQRLAGDPSLASQRFGGGRGVAVAIAMACALGPVAWMAWNAHAHDGPLHFFRRVAGYKRALGEGTTDVLAAALQFPRLLVTTRPEVTAPALLLLPALHDRALRRRWIVPLLCAAGQVLFLSYGNVRDGAPTHHAERALVGPLVILALFVGDDGWQRATDMAASGARRGARVAVACVLALWSLTIARDVARLPGNTEHEDRRAQVARGLRLRDEGAARLVVTPCAFEHFALLAAYGAPESAEVMPRTGAPPGPECPKVEAR